MPLIRVDALWLAVEPMDMRVGAERLLARVVQVFGHARTHHGYLFANARATRIKLLVHDGFVSVSGWHLELTRPAPDHCEHDELGGDDVQGGDAATRALPLGWLPGRLHRCAPGRVGHPARLLGLVVFSLRAATGAAATP